MSDMVKCCVCEDEFDYEGEGALRDGDYYCHDCWREHEFPCCLCEDYDDKEDDDGLPIFGTFLVVLRAKECGLRRRGVYEILQWPFYYDGCGIETSVMTERLKRRMSLPPDAPKPGDYNYAAGHLCRECMEKLGLDRTASGAYLQQKELAKEKP